MQSLETAVRDDEKFVETVCFFGKEGDSQTKSRLRLNKQMKTKTFQSLPPDKRSMLQAIKRIHYKVYYWAKVDEAIISDILLQVNVWIVDNENEEVSPIWFTGIFLISYLHFHSN